MKTVPVYNLEGAETGTVELPDEVFGIEPSMIAIYQVVKTYLANQRQGNASTKSRSEVDVTKSKPYRQKGTGRARAGSANSPLWVGGGVAFGPKPRCFDQRVNHKVRRLGLKSAYSIKATEDMIYVLEDFSLSEPKTKTVVSTLKAIGLEGKKITFLIPSHDEVLVKSTRNIPNFHIEVAENASTYDVMNSDVLLFMKTSVDRVKEFFLNEKQ